MYRKKFPFDSKVHFRQISQRIEIKEENKQKKSLRCLAPDIIKRFNTAFFTTCHLLKKPCKNTFILFGAFSRTPRGFFVLVKVRELVPNITLRHEKGRFFSCLSVNRRKKLVLVEKGQKD